MMDRMRWVSIGLIALAAATTAACSSDDSGGDGTPAGSTPETSSAGTTTTVHIKAAEGGTVTDPSGNTSLVIPPGALGDDVDITLQVIAKLGAAVVDVSDFGPSGLTFSTPATLTIKAAASHAPEGKTLALALQVGDEFQAVSGSTYANGAASAPITHFSRYSVIIVDGDVIVQPDSVCAAALKDFAPCGGELEGTWAFKDFCADNDTIGSTDDECPEATTSIEMQIDGGEVTFAGGNGSSTGATFKTFVTMNMPRSCIANMECSVMATSGLTCAEEPAGICKCTQQGEEQMDAETFTYTTEGATVTLDDGTSEYCVKGDELWIKRPARDDDPSILQILTRK